MHADPLAPPAAGSLAAPTPHARPSAPAPAPQISKTYTHYAATALFFAFGVRMLYDAAINAHAGESELNEVEKELSAAHKQPAVGATSTLENGTGAGHKRRESSTGPAVNPILSAIRKTVSPVLLEAFTLTFLAEWGDRSQIATIGLAAASDVVGVTLGGIVGHALCTGAAVLGGKHLASHIDERLVAIFGGVLFLIFGAHSLWSGVPE